MVVCSYGKRGLGSKGTGGCLRKPGVEEQVLDESTFTWHTARTRPLLPCASHPESARSCPRKRLSWRATLRTAHSQRPDLSLLTVVRLESHCYCSRCASFFFVPYRHITSKERRDASWLSPGGN
jgi:hypothetical protein